MSHRRKEGRVPRWMRRRTVHFNDKQAFSGIIYGETGTLHAGCAFHVIGGAEDDFHDYAHRRHQDRAPRGDHRQRMTRGRMLFWQHQGHTPPYGLDAHMVRSRGATTE